MKADEVQTFLICSYHLPKYFSPFDQLHSTAANMLMLSGACTTALIRSSLALQFLFCLSLLASPLVQLIAMVTDYLLYVRPEEAAEENISLQRGKY